MVLFPFLLVIFEILSSPSYGNLEADANLAGGKWGGAPALFPSLSFLPIYHLWVTLFFFSFILVFVIFLKFVICNANAM